MTSHLESATLSIKCKAFSDKLGLKTLTPQSPFLRNLFLQKKRIQERGQSGMQSAGDALEEGDRKLSGRNLGAAYGKQQSK